MDRGRRGSEVRPILLGAVLALLGVILAAGGALAIHRVRGGAQPVLSEWQLINAAARGGMDAEASGEPSSASQPAETRPADQKDQKKPPDFCST